MLSVRQADLGPGILYMIVARPGRRTLITNTFPVVAENAVQCRALRVTAALARTNAERAREGSAQALARSKALRARRDKLRIDSVRPYLHQLV